MEKDAFEITAFKILMYLNQQKGAKDPLNYVVDYWLRQRDREYVTIKVNEVLEELIARGVVMKVDQGGRDIYKINQEKREQVSGLLSLLKPKTAHEGKYSGDES